MLEDILIPFFICVVLPVSIVLIVYIAKMNYDNKCAKILITAIEANKGIDTDKLAEALTKPRKTDRQILYSRLLRGCIYSLIGIILLAIGLYYYASGKGDIVMDLGPVLVLLTILGGILIAIGASYLIVFFVSRKKVESAEKSDR